MKLNDYLDIHPDVEDAIKNKLPIVALESTIISHGMPYPDNIETALMVEDTVRSNNAIPATIAIINGRLKVGLSNKEIEFLATNNKVRKEILAKYKAKYDRRLLVYIRENDPFVNAVFLNYGWALTVHKALGSSFNETIINSYQGEGIGINNAEYFRWLYTSIATSENLVSIINPKEINPLMNCEFEDSTKEFTNQPEPKNIFLKLK